MDIDNKSVKAGNYHTLTITTPVAHKTPGTQIIEGGTLTAGNGEAAITSEGYYDGEQYILNDKVKLETEEAANYYKLTASGKGTVSKSAVSKQVTDAGFFEEDPEPVVVIPYESLTSETELKDYYIKKSALSTDHITPNDMAQAVSIGEGYYPSVRTVQIDPIVKSFPTTSYEITDVSKYFYSANERDYDFRIIPKYSNTAGYVIEHSNVNNGGMGHYKLKITQVQTGTTTVNGTTASRGIADWNDGWIDAGTIEAAQFNSAPTSGTTYVDISNTTDAPVLQSGDYLYVDAGYVDNIKISLSRLVPDAASSSIASEYILYGYSAYNNDGDLVVGNIQTYDGSYTLT